mgnify:FL=1
MNRKKLTFLSGFVVFLTIIVVFIYKNNFNKNNSLSEVKERKIEPFSGLAIMLETKAGSGVYNVSTSGTFPEKGYEFNSVKSGCENGGTLSYNKQTKKVTLKSNISDKCYIYFDLVPPDVSVAVNNLPSTYGKLGSITCDNSSTTYNQQYNRIEVLQINGKYTSCTLNYTNSSSRVYLATYIKGLAGTTQGTGQVVNENGYRYEGKNPNNYVWFNNEYWRIIGVFDSGSHGQANKNMVKIIRADVLDGLTWDKSNINDWTTASLNKLLNGSYYNAQDGTSSGYCYGYGTNATANCDYTKKGIQAGYRRMIANVTWYLGGYSSISSTAEAFYGYERGATVYSGRPTSTRAKIGLMYPSDYGYSALSSSCARTTNLGDYINSTCKGQSWLCGKGDEWTISPSSSSSYYVFYENYFGDLERDTANDGYGVRPVLYLAASVYKIDGEGTLDKPYIIGMWEPLV